MKQNVAFACHTEETNSLMYVRRLEREKIASAQIQRSCHISRIEVVIVAMASLDTEMNALSISLATFIHFFPYSFAIIVESIVLTLKWIRDGVLLKQIMCHNAISQSRIQIVTREIESSAFVFSFVSDLLFFKPFLYHLFNEF